MFTRRRAWVFLWITCVALTSTLPLVAGAVPSNLPDEVRRALDSEGPDVSSDNAEQGRSKSTRAPDEPLPDGRGPIGGSADPSIGVGPVVTGFGVFPVAADADLTNTYGAPRSGGRSHQGVDIFAPKMAPVVAVAAGVVVKAKVSSGRSGTYVVIEHPDGTKSYYLHLNNDTPGTDDGLGEGIAPGIASGVAVSAGTVVGFVGDSGNAEDTPPHLHFEFHVAGAGAVDPYTLLLAAERGEVGLLGLQALPHTGSNTDRELVVAIALIVAGMMIIWRDRQLELVIVRTSPVITLALQFLLWRGQALDRLMGERVN